MIRLPSCRGWTLLLVLLAGIYTVDAFGFEGESQELPIEMGDEIEGWTVERIDRHDEYVRYWFRGSEGTTGVEIDKRDDQTRPYTAGEYWIQSAPGERPPERLLAAVRERVAAFDSTSEPFIQRTSPNQALFGTQLLPYRVAVAWLSLLLAVISALMCLRFSMKQRGVWLNRRDITVALVLAAAAALILVATQIPIPVTPDVARDALIGRDCWQRSDCLVGPQTSFLNLIQGTTWARISSLSWALCSEESLVRGFWNVLAGAGVGLVYVAARLGLGRMCSLLAGLVYFVAFCFAMDTSEFSNHTAVAIAAPLALFAATASLRSRGAFQAIALGLCCGFAIESHAACWWFLVPALVQVLATARRPLLAASVCLGSCLALSFSLSPLALLTNIDQIVDVVGWLPIGAISAAATVVGLWMRRFSVSWSDGQRLRVAVALWSATYTVLAIAVMGIGKHFHHVYALPVLPFVSVLAVDGIWWLRSRIGSWVPLRPVEVLLISAALAGVIPASSHRLSPPNPDSSPWTMGELELIAEEVYQGTDFPELAAAIRSPDHRQLLTGLAPLDPALPGPSDGRAILIAKIQVRSPWRLARLGWGYLPA